MQFALIMSSSNHFSHIFISSTASITLSKKSSARSLFLIKPEAAADLRWHSLSLARHSFFSSADSSSHHPEGHTSGYLHNSLSLLSRAFLSLVLYSSVRLTRCWIRSASCRQCLSSSVSLLSQFALQMRAFSSLAACCSGDSFLTRDEGFPVYSL